MTCKQCIQSSGMYDLKCVECCARLVISTRPSKPRASAMLAAIERINDAPSRDVILDRVKTIASGKADL